MLNKSVGKRPAPDRTQQDKYFNWEYFGTQTPCKKGASFSQPSLNPFYYSLTTTLIKSNQIRKWKTQAGFGSLFSRVSLSSSPCVCGAPMCVEPLCALRPYVCWARMCVEPLCVLNPHACWALKCVGPLCVCWTLMCPSALILFIIQALVACSVASVCLVSVVCIVVVV